MTVAELIEELGKCPKDARVYTDDLNIEVGGVEVDVTDDMETRVYIFADIAKVVDENA